MFKIQPTTPPRVFSLAWGGVGKGKRKAREKTLGTRLGFNSLQRITGEAIASSILDTLPQ